MKTATPKQPICGIADLKKETCLQRVCRIKALLEWSYIDPETITTVSTQIEEVVRLLELPQIKRDTA